MRTRDKGQGGQKIWKFCGHHMYMPPNVCTKGAGCLILLSSLLTYKVCMAVAQVLASIYCPPLSIKQTIAISAVSIPIPKESQFRFFGHFWHFLKESIPFAKGIVFKRNRFLCRNRFLMWNWFLFWNWFIINFVILNQNLVLKFIDIIHTKWLSSSYHDKIG